jgi:formylglycine-generating enzyme required for sulfatase activity
MSIFNIVFWLLIIFIAALAFAIESGLTARHRRVVLSSIFTATITAVYMMFVVEDNTAFDFKPPPKAPAKEKGEETVVTMDDVGGGEKKKKTKRKHIGLAKDEGLSEAARLMSMPSGFTECEACPLMVGVEAGAYIMGSPIDEAGRQPGEGPQKQITIAKPFAVSRYEIKRIEYSQFVKESRHRSARGCFIDGKFAPDADWLTPGFKQENHHPAVCVSWQDAKAYADWLSAKTKRTYRLLSEAEWEYVARAGTTGPYWQGRSFSHETALFGGVRKGTMSSGQFPDNHFKVFDTSGNVWEFTADCYAPNLANVPINALPAPEPLHCTSRVVRGGAWDSPQDRVRSASRQGFVADKGANNTGIRVARLFHEAEKPGEQGKPKKRGASGETGKNANAN